MQNNKLDRHNLLANHLTKPGSDEKENMIDDIDQFLEDNEDDDKNEVLKSHDNYQKSRKRKA